MSKPRKKQGNPDFRHPVSVPAPASEEIESRLFHWRIEDAFLLTKRLLGLSYLWVGGSNGV